MDKSTFTAHLEEATQKIIIFTRGFVFDELPDSALYLMVPNASYDGNPLHLDEEVFPQDSLPAEQKHLPVTNTAGVVNFLWRNGKVPEWINISVADTDAHYTYLCLLCCGRYTAGEGLYHVGEGLPPFHLLSPFLPNAKKGKFYLPRNAFDW